MERLIPLSFSQYQSRHSSSSRVRCALVIRNSTRSFRNIFSRIQWNFLLSSSEVATPLRRASALLRLWDYPDIWPRSCPALWITPLCLFVRYRAGDDDVLARQPVDWRGYLVLCS